MNHTPTFDEIEREFEDSFGYIQNDMKAIGSGTQRVNYTLAALIGIACEMLAAPRGMRGQPEAILQEVIPSPWKPLAKALFDAMRNGLAHGFDTKHIMVGGVPHQIYMQWQGTTPLELILTGGRVQFYLRPRPLADLICSKIDELREQLKTDSEVRHQWLAKCHRYKREIYLDPKATSAWKDLLNGSEGLLDCGELVSET
jgi:hypothetical protein